ncbi:MAG: acyltransferase [Egibacteraceae bacterium]
MAAGAAGRAGAGGPESAAPPARSHDRYADALRAGALLVVVLGHWLATLPRVDGGLQGADHLLDVWRTAGLLTWVLQVVPLFMFVSAAVTAHSADRVNREGVTLSAWWGARALRLARPTATYLWALALLVGAAAIWAGTARFIDVFDQSLTVHLWFLVMLLALQACLPAAVAADRRWGWRVVLGLVVAAGGVEVVRALTAGPVTPATLSRLGDQVTAVAGGPGWLNMMLVWLVPQQLGVIWGRKGLRSPGGAGLVALGLLWLLVAVRAGYPTAMVGGDLAGSSNVLPPTLALLGVIWLQVGMVVALEPLARRVAARGSGRVVALLTALGMPLYLWHKLAEVPAAAIAVRLGLPVDAGDPGDPAFWAARLLWIGLATLMVGPVLLAVVAFERRRRATVPVTARPWRVAVGGALLLAGLVAALYLGASAALGAAVAVTAASLLLRAGRGAGAGQDARTRRS